MPAISGPLARRRTINVRNPGSYHLQVTDANSCTGSDTIAVVAKQCLNGVFIPTAFTPNNNGDFINLFKPIIHGTLVQHTIEVYDRAGQRVFSAHNAALGWRGELQGITQPSGVYVWQCRYQLTASTSISKGNGDVDTVAFMRNTIGKNQFSLPCCLSSRMTFLHLHTITFFDSSDA